MTRNLLITVALIAGLAMTALSSNACDPNHDPGCDRSAETMAPAPCDPKSDPGCE